MAEDKLLNRGPSGRLPATLSDGKFYLTTDDSGLFIDAADDDGGITRHEINPTPDWNATKGRAQILNKPGAATKDKLGLVKPDGTTITADANGMLSAVSSSVAAVYTATLSGPGWVAADSYFTQTVAIDGITSAMSVLVGLNSEAGAKDLGATLAFSDIYYGETIDNGIIFYAVSSHAIDINIQIAVLAAEDE